MLKKIIFAALLCQIYCAKFPPGIKLCHKSDPNFNECVRVNMAEGIRIFAKGYRELGVSSLEPFHIDKIEIEGAKSGSVSLDQKYEHVGIFGSTDAEIQKLNINHEDCSWKLTILSKSVVMKSDYNLKGQLLVFPINGHGKCVVTMENLLAHHELKCERVTKKNKTFLKVTDYTIVMEPEKIIYDFQNIIPGNEQVSAELVKTINENGLSIFKDIKPGFEKVFATLYRNTINSIFAKIPENEIFLD